MTYALDTICRALSGEHPEDPFFHEFTFDLSGFTISHDALGPLKLPLTPAPIKRMITHADPAPFGLREQTLIDRSVRDCWQIEATQLTLADDWLGAELPRILDTIRQKLEFGPGRLDAVPDKLLIYEKGQFFTHHQDSEKCDEMAATLVLVLPSRHTGGALSIEHAGRQHLFRSETRYSTTQVKGCAFYADCYHAVDAVRSGYRVALTFNLLFQPQANQPELSADEKAHQQLVKLLSRFFSNQDNRKDWMLAEKLVCLLDHQYTERSLAWSKLKGADKRYAGVLRRAAEAMDLEIYLALGDHHQTWDAWDEGEQEWGYRRRYWDEDEGESDGSYVLNDLIEESVTLRKLRGPDGKTASRSELVAYGHEVCAPAGPEQLEPYETKYEGYTGNAGNTLERWYHRSALVLWPKQHNIRVRFRHDQAALLQELAEQAGAGKAAETESQLEELARHLPHRFEPSVSVLQSLLDIFAHVRNASLAGTFLERLSLAVFAPQHFPGFLKLLSNYGYEWSSALLLGWIKGGRSQGVAWQDWFGKLGKFIGSLHRQSDPQCERLIDAVLATFAQLLQQHAAGVAQHAGRKSLLELSETYIGWRIGVIDAALLGERTDHADAQFQEIEPYPTLYGAEACLPLFERYQGSGLEKLDGYRKLFRSRLEGLENVLSAGERRADDWSITTQSTCQCADCATLNRFLRESRKISMRWPLSKEKRRHIHGVIDRLDFPVSHHTQRTGRPYSLILKKLPRLFEDDQAHYQRCRELLERYRSM